MNEAVLEGFRSARGSSCEWYTPPHIFEALGLEFDLDPCSPPLPAAMWIPAANRISLPDDGLAADWAHRERWVCDDHPRIWLNPPYGREETARWVGRLANHGRGIALIFARTDTPWWQRCARAATAVTFIYGRVGFVSGDRGDHTVSNHAGAPSCLLAYGGAEAQACADSGLGITFDARELLGEPEAPDRLL